MSQQTNNSDKLAEKAEFYIGWQPQAPLSFSQHVKKVLIVVAVAFVIIGIALAISQKKFSTANFEFGKPTQVKGIYFNKPVPNIKVINGKDILGNLSYITIPLVGYGKFGAAGIINDIEKEKNISLHTKEITLKGTLLYNDGKTLMQIEANDKPVLNIGNTAHSALLPIQKELGLQTIKGEIIDPKCYFGVMKPGEGKAHKDCAIRCILGGIPPVFHVRNEKGESNYYLIVGPNGEKMNEAVIEYVAEPITLKAKAVRYDDWIVLYISGKDDIHSYSYIQSHFPNQVLSCCSNCMK